MLSYLAAESNFVRAFGNRCLLLLFLCVLTRTGETAGKAAVLGIAVDISQGLVVVVGPILALLFLISLKLEADNLIVGRHVTLSEIQDQTLRRFRANPLLYGLFAFPTLAALFLLIQFYQNLVPVDAACPAFDRFRYFYDFRSLQAGFPTKYCIHDISIGMPWIYPPLQLYLYAVVTASCGWLSYRIAREWTRFR